MKDTTGPAFPLPSLDVARNIHDQIDAAYGLTKREYVATQVLAGLVVGLKDGDIEGCAERRRPITAENLTRAAYYLADALLEQSNAEWTT